MAPEAPSRARLPARPVAPASGARAAVDPAPAEVAALRGRLADASVELRQVLMQLSGELELALVNADLGRGTMARAKLYELLLAVDRAADIVAHGLDPGPVSGGDLLVLEREGLDLAEAAAQALLDLGPAARAVRVHGGPAEVCGDRALLTGALGALVGFFLRQRTPAEQVVVDLWARGTTAEAFVGLIPAHLSLEHLVDVLARDRDGCAFARQVVERHGGTLVVARGWRGAAGFAFTLPSLDSVRRR